MEPTFNTTVKSDKPDPQRVVVVELFSNADLDRQCLMGSSPCTCNMYGIEASAKWSEERSDQGSVVLTTVGNVLVMIINVLVSVYPLSQQQQNNC